MIVRLTPKERENLGGANATLYDLLRMRGLDISKPLTSTTEPDGTLVVSDQ